MPVLRPSGGTEWEVTGRWTAAAADLSGSQGWLLRRDWYRLTGDVAPWGRVVLWGQLPGEWIEGDPKAVPTVEPPWGETWRTVPYSMANRTGASSKRFAARTNGFLIRFMHPSTIPRSPSFTVPTMRPRPLTAGSWNSDLPF